MSFGCASTGAGVWPPVLIRLSMWYREVTMCDFSELDISRKEMAVLVLVVFIFMVVVFSAGYCVGLWHGNKISDNGTGTESIGNELEQAGTNISNAEAGIGQAENHAGNVEAGIGNAQESADYLQGTVSTSTELIGQCQSIIERIRSRGETEAK